MGQDSEDATGTPPNVTEDDELELHTFSSIPSWLAPWIWELIVSHGSFVTISKSLYNSFSSISESKCTYQKFSTWLVHALLAGLTNPWVWFTVWKGFATILHCNTTFNNLKALQALLDFVTTLGQWLNSYKIQYVTKSDKAALKEYDIGNKLSSHRMQYVTELSDGHKIQ